MRTNFWSLFKLYPDGSIEPLRLVRIGGVQFGPGVRFGRGVSFGNIDLTQYAGRDLEVQENGTISVITGIY